MGDEPFANRIRGYEDVDPRNLAAHPENWRVHPQHQEVALKGVLTEVGWLDPVKVNKRTGRIIDGHLRVAMAIKRGLPTVPVAWLDLDEDEERKALVTLNPIGELAIADDERLAQLIAGVTFDDAAIVEMLSGLGSGNAGGGESGSDGGRESDRCEYPLVPRLGESYDYVVVFTTNLLDFTWLADALQLKTERSYKSTAVGQGRVITFDRFRELWESRHGGG